MCLEFVVYVLNDGILSFTSINFRKIETRFNVKKNIKRQTKNMFISFISKLLFIILFQNHCRQNVKSRKQNKGTFIFTVTINENIN